MQLKLWDEALVDLNEAQRLAKACPTSSPQTFSAYIKTFQRKGEALTGVSATVQMYTDTPE